MNKKVVENLVENGFKVEVKNCCFEMTIEDIDIGIFYSKYYNNYSLIMSKMIDGKCNRFFSEEFEDLDELYECIENELDLDFGFERL